MPIKAAPKKPSKVNMKQAEGGQDNYANWDAGRYDREGWGLGQFRTPPSEDFPPKASEPQKQAKRVK